MARDIITVLDGVVARESGEVIPASSLKYQRIPADGTYTLSEYTCDGACSVGKPKKKCVTGGFYSQEKCAVYSLEKYVPDPRDQQISELKAQVELLRQDTSTYNTESVLCHLVEAVKHLLTDHDCDQDGHEYWHTAVTEGERILRLWSATRSGSSRWECDITQPEAQAYKDTNEKLMKMLIKSSQDRASRSILPDVAEGFATELTDEQIKETMEGE